MGPDPKTGFLPQLSPRCSGTLAPCNRSIAINLPGWQPKETAFYLPHESRADCFNNATPSSHPEAVVWAGPLTTSFTGLWAVASCPVQWLTGGDPKTDQASKGTTQNSRTGNPKRSVGGVTAQTGRGPKDLSVRRGGPKDPWNVLSTTQVTGRRDATQSRNLQPAYRHLEPPEVGPLRVIQGRPDVHCRQEGSRTVMSEVGIFVSSPNDHITRATDVMIVGKLSSVCLSWFWWSFAACRM